MVERLEVLLEDTNCGGVGAVILHPVVKLQLSWNILHSVKFKEVRDITGVVGVGVGEGITVTVIISVDADMHVNDAALDRANSNEDTDLLKLLNSSSLLGTIPPITSPLRTSAKTEMTTAATPSKTRLTNIIYFRVAALLLLSDIFDATFFFD
jgi:hypothetical protein